MVLIPLFYLIGYFGSRNKKIKAQVLLLLYTIFGSLFLLIGIILLYQYTGSTNYIQL